MKAARYWGNGRIRVEDVACPEIAENEILLRVKACSICGTDLRILRGEKTNGVRIPSVVGHELSGEVEAVGGSITGIAPGDRVAVAPVVPCRECRACRRGFTSICENRTAIGYEYDGGFQQLLKLPSALVASGNVLKLPPTISFAEASLLEPLSCCIHGQHKMRVRPDESVLIFGAGPIGLMHLALLKTKRVGRVIVCECNPNRLRVAEELGADEALDSLGKIGPCDHIVCAVGVPDLIPELVARLRRGGTLLLFAGFSRDAGVEVDLNALHYHELAMIGSSASTLDDFREALRMCSCGDVQLSRLISHRVPLSQIDQAFELAGSGAAIKVVVEP